MKKLRGEKDIEATLERLDRLTLDEARATAAQTLEVVYSLVRHRRVVMDGDIVFTGPALRLILIVYIQAEIDRKIAFRVP